MVTVFSGLLQKPIREKHGRQAPARLSWGLKNDLPEVEQATRLMTFPDIETMLLKYEHNSETKQFFETNGYYVDSTFFQIFTYDFIYGNAATALDQPNSIVISEQLSHKFFGNENPVGKAIMITTPFGEFNYTVKGVFNSARINRIYPPTIFSPCAIMICGTGYRSKPNGLLTIFFLLI